MEVLSLKEITSAVEGVLIKRQQEQEQENEGLLISGVAIDSRKVIANSIFIALIGINADGHEYVAEASENGAALAIVSRRIDCNIQQILVKDTGIALKKLAAYYRSSFNIPVIGVTGSTGKTSTKEIIASVLEQKYNVHKTMMNYNNEIGLPLTILELNKENEISILEMGMNNLGEIKRLAEISRPSIGVITNIGTAHIENLGSRENILKAKMEITTYFSEDSLLIVNGDDELLSGLLNTNYTLIKISMNNNGDYNAFEIVDLGEMGVEFKCKYKNEVCKFKINAPGKHNIYNALSAIAIGHFFNMSVKDIQVGLENYKPVGERMNIIKLRDRIKIINDCYNANPDSMKAALDVLATFEGGRKIAILGDMFELGSFSEAAHQDIGKYSKDRCNILIAIGNMAVHIYNEAKENAESYYFKTKDEANSYIRSIIKEGDIILIKASRGMKMEDITNYLVEDGKRVI